MLLDCMIIVHKIIFIASIIYTSLDHSIFLLLLMQPRWCRMHRLDIYILQACNNIRRCTHYYYWAGRPAHIYLIGAKFGACIHHSYHANRPSMARSLMMGDRPQPGHSVFVVDCMQMIYNRQAQTSCKRPGSFFLFCHS